ncbi:MAG: DUF4349 domain-containing protein [Candidatus Gracilibacteria bacterium]
MKSLKIVFLLLFLVVLSACQGPMSVFRSQDSTVSSYGPYVESSYSEYTMSDKMMATGSANLSESSAYSPEVDRQVIKTGSLGLHVTDVRDSSVQIKTYVDGLKGTISDMSITRGDNSYSGSLTVRVPSEKFEEAMTGLKDMAVYVDYEYNNANNVTEYYTDLEQRLTNKKAEEQQYLDILDQAVNVTEILAVTQYLSNVRYEIENLQGQINSYDSQINYSTISVVLSEDESISAVTETWKPIATLKEAMSNWVVFLQGSVDFVIYLVIFGWPLLIIGFGLRYYFSRRKRGSKK